MTANADKFMSLTLFDGGTVTFDRKDKGRIIRKRQHQVGRSNQGRCSASQRTQTQSNKH